MHWEPGETTEVLGPPWKDQVVRHLLLHLDMH